MEDLLELAIREATNLGASYAEVRYQNDSYESVFLRNGVVEAGALSVDKGISVRVIYGSALGFASTNELSGKGVRKAAKEAVTLAKASASLVKRGVRLADAKLGEQRVIVKPRVKHENIDGESKAELLREIDRSIVEIASRNDVKVVSRVMELWAGYTEKLVINTDGARVYSNIPRSALDYMYTLVYEGRSLQRHENLGEARGWEAVERWKVDEKAKDEVTAISKTLKDGIEPLTGELDVILGSEIVALVCHESAGHPAEADRLLGREAAQAGETYIKRELIGSAIGSEYVTIVDDPSLPNSFGFYLYDDEGVAVRERVLIEKGQIKELLHNRETAAEFSLESNGSARANAYDREPIVRMANTYMKPGDYNIDELIEDVKRGIYVKSYHEWNIDDKRWNQRYVGVEAYLIEEGKLTKPVYRPVVELTTKSLFSSIDAVGKDLEFYAGYCGKGDPMQAIPVWFGGPSVRLRNVRLNRS